MPYIFFPLASDSAVGFTGFTLAASAGGILDSGAGVFAGGSSFCAHSANARKSKRRRISGVLFFNTPLLFGSTVETFNNTPQQENVHEKLQEHDHLINPPRRPGRETSELIVCLELGRPSGTGIIFSTFPSAEALG